MSRCRPDKPIPPQRQTMLTAKTELACLPRRHAPRRRSIRPPAGVQPRERAERTRPFQRLRPTAPAVVRHKRAEEGAAVAVAAAVVRRAPRTAIRCRPPRASGERCASARRRTAPPSQAPAHVLPRCRRRRSRVADMRKDGEAQRAYAPRVPSSRLPLRHDTTSSACRVARRSPRPSARWQLQYRLYARTPDSCQKTVAVAHMVRRIPGSRVRRCAAPASRPRRLSPPTHAAVRSVLQQAAAAARSTGSHRQKAPRFAAHGASGVQAGGRQLARRGSACKRQARRKRQ